MNTKIVAVVATVVLALMIIAPIYRVGASGAVMSVLQYRYYDSQSTLFAELQVADSAGGVDIMGWPLTHAQYDTILSNPNIIVTPLVEAGEFEIAFNNNWTDMQHPDAPQYYRNYMNYTDFRNALNCLVNKPGVIAASTLGGFATRSDTQVPDPLMHGYVNTAVSYPYYPWEYNETKALQILWTGGWYNHLYYPVIGPNPNPALENVSNDLIDTFLNGTLATYAGTGQGVVYSGNDPYGQWGGSDPNANANAARANTAIDPVVNRYRTNDARKDLGEMFYAELQKIGCPQTVLNGYPTLTALRPYVLKEQLYDWSTLGYSMSSPPNWWYTELTPAGIYTNGPNPYLVQDPNTTKYAYAAFTDPDPASYDADQKTCQYNLVMESYLVPGYCPATYCAYKTGLLGTINEVGYGMQGFNQLLNWVTQNMRKTNTVAYHGSPSSAPESNIIYYGMYNPPDMLNPIMSDEVFDFQPMDEMWTYPLATNPYSDMVAGSALTGYPNGGDLPWMAYAWSTTLVNDPYNAANPQWTNVTLWFRHDITWHDTTPFDVNDLNYTIYINAFYGDSWTNAAMVYAANCSVAGTPDKNYEAKAGTSDPNYAAPYFTRWDQWTCSILVKSPSWLNLYIPNYEIVPQHIYKWITTNDPNGAETAVATDGLHGLWPGQAAVAGNIVAGAPFTLSDIHSKPEITFVGTGPWQYRVGSTDASKFAAGGGITEDAYPNFFMRPVPGTIAFLYHWVGSYPYPPASGGSYYIGLPDLTMLANSYGTTGTPPSSVPITQPAHHWEAGCDLAAPSGVIGLSDLTTLALHYGWYWGNYSYNAPYPPAEQANPP